MGCWITLGCGRKLINLQPFLDADQMEELQYDVLQTLHEQDLAAEADSHD